MGDTAWPHLDAGKMRHKISIQAQSAVKDSLGEQAASWTTVWSCYAAIETLSTREQFQDGFVSQVVHRISIRWPGSSVRILASMRVLFGTSVYEVQASENVQERNLIVRMTCIEIDSAQVGQ